ncbi:hypothetical protein H0H93_012509 [Arthromyces matolae]|nr:hypothetical protein H0H93_012509 [Arthromyces matolae]
MTEREAKIRRFEPSDDKRVRFVVGKAAMESLAVANRRAYIHPLIISAWLFLSYAVINYMNRWPRFDQGFLGYLRPIPLLAASMVPVMFLIDWLNRPDFENITEHVLRGPDMSDLHTFYTSRPGSGLWICEFGGLFVGLIALDANSDALVKDEKENRPSTSAVIRHFYVDEVYRKSGIQEDLLSHALRMAFDAEPALQVVNAHDSPLLPYIRNCLQNAAFISTEELNKSGIPLLRSILINSEALPSTRSFLFSFLYPPAHILPDVSSESNIQVFNWLDSIPDYTVSWSDRRREIFIVVESALPGSIQIIIDSIDVLSEDIGSIIETYAFFSSLLRLIRARPEPSRLILHATLPSQLTPLLTQPTFSPSLIQLIVHPVALLKHLAKEYLTLPPPSSPRAKFWSTFLPLSDRTHDIERLVYGTNGDGDGSGRAVEMAVDVLVRGGDGKKRGFERELEGWSLFEGPCDLTKLERLKEVWIRKAAVEVNSITLLRDADIKLSYKAGIDPTQNVSFNLNLTLAQQESRAQVPLPYAHGGKSLAAAASIFYDPDSADDLDDDDPDEDLDI